MTVETMYRPLAEDEAVSVATTPDWTPILPVPANAPPFTNSIINHYAPPGFAFTAGWRYLDAAGNLLGCVVRYDRPTNGAPAEKQVLPFTFCEGRSGAPGWTAKEGMPQITKEP